jgi:hypothetical protein
MQQQVLPPVSCELNQAWLLPLRPERKNSFSVDRRMMDAGSDVMKNIRLQEMQPGYTG